MMPSSLAAPSRWLFAALLGAVLLPAARAADGERGTLNIPSLKEAPADAAYYSVLLRAREQFDLAANSKAWKKFSGLPGIQFAWQAMRLRVGGQYDKFVEDPENQQLVDLAIDMVSAEVFSYGGANASDVAQLLTDVASALNYGPIMIQLQGNPKGLDQQGMQMAAVMQALVRNIDLIKSPDTVIGFKLSKTEPAVAQIKRLEKLLTKVAEQKEELKGRVKRVKVADGDFLAITLEGKMLPLETVLDRLKEYEDKKGDYDAVLKKLKDLKLTFALGVRKGYLIFAAGETTAHLEKLGQGKSLAGRPEFAPLAKYADQRLTSINYLSKELHAKVGPSKKDIQNYLKLADTWTANSDLTPEQKSRLQKDLAAFAKEVEAYLPEAGAVLGFTFMTTRGKEGYVYDWTKNLQIDASKPLMLLNHVGGSPLIAVVARGKSSPDEYAKFAKWVKMAHGWAEEIGLPKLSDEQKDQYKQVMTIVQPLLKRLDTATGKMLVPAVGTEGAFVLDAKLTSKQWFPAMPQASKALPLLEPAVVININDPDLLVKAFTEYRAIANDLAKEVHKFKEEVPETPLPAPKTIKVKGGTLYSYPLPQDWGVEKVLPNFFVGDKIAGATISEEHSVRLLTPTPLKTDGGPLADPKKKLASASYVNWNGMIDLFVPWVEYGFDLAPGGGLFDKDDILKQVKGAFDSLKAFRSSTAATYEEDGAIVTHSETIIRDLP